jgi:hypothetical protein
VSDFVPEDPDAIAIAEAWRENPSETASQIAAHAAAAQFEALQPAVEEVLSLHRQQAWDAATEEAREALVGLYGRDTMNRYRDAMGDWLEAHPEVIPDEKAHDAQFVAEVMQSVLRTVRPTVDAQSTTNAWDAVKATPPADYYGTMAKSGR